VPSPTAVAAPQRMDAHPAAFVVALTWARGEAALHSRDARREPPPCPPHHASCPEPGTSLTVWQSNHRCIRVEIERDERADVVEPTAEHDDLVRNTRCSPQRGGHRSRHPAFVRSSRSRSTRRGGGRVREDVRAAPAMPPRRD
jgi:hypothetical protein